MPDIPAPANTAVRALLASAARHGLIIIGTWLVSHGALDARVVNDATGPIVDAIVGTTMIAGATAWGQIRAAIAHSRFAKTWGAWAALNAPTGSPAPSPAPYLEPGTVLLGGASLAPADAGQAVGAGPTA